MTLDYVSGIVYVSPQEFADIHAVIRRAQNTRTDGRFDEGVFLRGLLALDMPVAAMLRLGRRNWRLVVREFQR